MPTSFLLGYFETKEEATTHSIDCTSEANLVRLDAFQHVKTTTLLLGINEKCGDEIYNTVDVIEQGKHLGKYRKAYTCAPYDEFSLGGEFPVFEKNGVRYGVVMCIGSADQEPANILALNGAQLIFFPMLNRLKIIPEC